MFTELLQIYRSSVQAVRPDSLIKNAIKIKDGIMSTNEISSSERLTTTIVLENRDVFLFGAGKAVLHMCEEFLNQVEEYNHQNNVATPIQIIGGKLLVPIGSKAFSDRLFRKYNVTYHQCAQNNIPDHNSWRHSQSLLNQIKSLPNKTKFKGRLPLVIGFISGGGSALFTCPKEGINLEDKIEIIKQLVKLGVDIIELNTIRSCLSEVKGGEFARKVVDNSHCQLVTFIISDIINDPIEMIASGPTIIPDRQHLPIGQRAINILDKYKINVKPKITEAIRSKSIERSNDIQNANLITNLIIGNNHIALNAAQQMSNFYNYKAISLGTDINGEASMVAKKLLDNVLTYRMNSDEWKQYRGVCWLGGGETTISMNSQLNIGLGGRCQEMGLVMLYEMFRLKDSCNNLAISELEVLLAGTDGQDGPTTAAGVNLKLIPMESNLLQLGDKIEEALKHHDSYNFFKNHIPHALIETGPSGTNVMDIYCIIAKFKFV